METEATGIEPTVTYKEHIPLIHDQQYHGRRIRIVEMDHRGSSDNTVEKNVTNLMPENWRLQVKKLITESGDCPIMPEYCYPDLVRRAYSEPGLGKLARIEGDNQHINPFFSFIARLAGKSGRTLLAADPANTSWFVPFETLSRVKLHVQDKITTREIDLKRPDGYYRNISETEYKTPTSIDSRRLLTARGLMQEVLRQPILDPEMPSIIHINAPLHAERVNDYILRQINWEEKSSIKVERPSDQSYVSPPDERKKMLTYGRPPLERSVRTYLPVLPKECFEIDLAFHDEDPPTFNEDLPTNLYLKLTDLSEIITSYLESSFPQNNNQEKYQQNLKQAGALIERSLSTNEGYITTKEWKMLSSLITTEKLGWKLDRKSLIH